MNVPDEYANKPFRHPVCWMEDHTKWFLPMERAGWRTMRAIRHPRTHWYWWRKMRNHPKPGDWVWACDSQRHQVKEVVKYKGDYDLRLEGGETTSWMNCCSWEKE